MELRLPFHPFGGLVRKEEIERELEKLRGIQAVRRKYGLDRAWFSGSSLVWNMRARTAVFFGLGGGFIVLATMSILRFFTQFSMAEGMIVSLVLVLLTGIVFYVWNVILHRRFAVKDEAGEWMYRDRSTEIRMCETDLRTIEAFGERPIRVLLVIHDGGAHEANRAVDASSVTSEPDFPRRRDLN